MSRYTFLQKVAIPVASAACFERWMHDNPRVRLWMKEILHHLGLHWHMGVSNYQGSHLRVPRIRSVVWWGLCRCPHGIEAPAYRGAKIVRDCSHLLHVTYLNSGILNGGT